MSDRLFWVMITVLCIMFAGCVGGLVYSLGVQEHRTAQQQQYTITIHYAPHEQGAK